MAAGDMFAEQFDPYAHAATTDRTSLLEVELAQMHRNLPKRRDEKTFLPCGPVAALSGKLPALANMTSRWAIMG